MYDVQFLHISVTKPSFLHTKLQKMMLIVIIWVFTQTNHTIRKFETYQHDGGFTDNFHFCANFLLQPTFTLYICKHS